VAVPLRAAPRGTAWLSQQQNGLSTGLVLWLDLDIVNLIHAFFGVLDFSDNCCGNPRIGATKCPISAFGRNRLDINYFPDWVIGSCDYRVVLRSGTTAPAAVTSDAQ